jgi:hypothetical protein
MAIWSITSRTVKTKFRFVSTENALPWGLSFGYAYAGSVAMLATAFEDITYVMVTGHIIALLTITWIQRSVLIRILNQHDFEVTTVRSAKQNESSPQISTESEESTSPSTEEAVALDDGIDVQWDGAVGPSIGDDIEWNDVIELND